jgi:hypothetical protein
MCDACESDHTRRWTSTRLIVLTFVAHCSSSPRLGWLRAFGRPMPARWDRVQPHRAPPSAFSRPSRVTSAGPRAFARIRRRSWATSARSVPPRPRPDSALLSFTDVSRSLNPSRPLVKRDLRFLRALTSGHRPAETKRRRETGRIQGKKDSASMVMGHPAATSHSQPPVGQRRLAGDATQHGYREEALSMRRQGAANCGKHGRARYVARRRRGGSRRPFEEAVLGSTTAASRAALRDTGTRSGR